MLKKKPLIPPLVLAMAFFVAAVVALSGPPAFAQQDPQITVTGELTAADHIIDEESQTRYELVSTDVDLGSYVGERVEISGELDPGPTPLLKVTRVSVLPKLEEGTLPDSPKEKEEKTEEEKEEAKKAEEVAKEEKKQKADQQEAAKPEQEPSSLERVAEKLRELVRGSIAFNTPEEMQVGKTETIELLLSTSSSAEELKQQLTEAGEKEGAEGIPTADRMQARLTGDPGFVIQAITPEEQAISSEETTKWRWGVTPTQAGEEKKLHLTITALIEVAEETTPRAIDTYNRTIMVKEVQKSWGQRVSEFIGHNWQWLWTSILAPIAFWAYRIYRRRTKAKQKSDAA
jgi:hypothetical protein